MEPLRQRVQNFGPTGTLASKISRFPNHSGNTFHLRYYGQGCLSHPISKNLDRRAQFTTPLNEMNWERDANAFFIPCVFTAFLRRRAHKITKLGTWSTTKKIQSSSRFWKQISQKYKPRKCRKLALRYCRTLPQSDQDQTNDVRLLATCMLIFLRAEKQFPHKTHFTLCCACCSLAEAERATSLVTHVC